MQTLRNVLRPRQLAGLSRHPPTGARVEAFCGKKNFQLRTVSVPAVTGKAHKPASPFPDAILHFITPKYEDSKVRPKTGRTVLYFHGGGYHNPLIGNAHIPFALDMATSCKADSLVVLEYSLAPEHPYPSQFVQAVASLRYLIEEQHLSPSDIILAGDSAGGHLILGLLAHLVEPAPYAPVLDLLSKDGKPQPLLAAVLVSPWVSMRGEEASIHVNERDDFLSKSRIVDFTDYLRLDFDDVWANPWEAPNAKAVWDKIFPSSGEALCRKVITTVGTSEILLDSCIDFGQNFVKSESVQIDSESDLGLVQGHGKDFVLAVVSGEAHVQPGLDNGMRFKGGLTSRAVLRFMETV